MSLYVAGPMSGLPDYNREAFDQAADRLRSEGVSCATPIETAIEAYGTWEAAKQARREAHVRADLTVLLECDGVVFLPGWEESPGALLEARVALATGKYFRIYDATRTSAAVPLLASHVEDVLDGTVVSDLAREALSDLHPHHPEWHPPFLSGWGHSEIRESARPVVTPVDDPIVVPVSDGAYDGDRFVPYSESPGRQIFGSGGIKDNRGKAPIDLLPSRPLVAIAEVLAFGAHKYQPHNWRRGLPWPDTYSSLQRHLLAWNNGEDLDEETGKSHLAHAGCQLMFLLDYVLTGVEEDSDTRFIPCEAEDCAKGLHPTSDHAGAA